MTNKKEGWKASETGQASIEFYMQDKVNAFSGLADEK